ICSMLILALIIPIVLIISFLIYGLFFRESIPERINKALTLMEMDNLDLALNILNDLAHKHKDIAEVHWYLADIFYKKKMLEQAEQECQKVLALKKFTSDINEAVTRKQLARIYWEEKKLDEAYKELILVSQIQPEDTPVYMDLGKISLEKEMPRDAIMYFEKYIDKNPESGLAHHFLGRSYFSLNLYDEAEEKFSKSLEIDTSINSSHYYLGILYTRKKMYDKALSEFEFPQADTQMRFQINYQKGNIFFSKEMYENAVTFYKKALSFPGMDIEAEQEIKYRLGISLAKVGKIDEAIKHWEELFRRNPQYRDVREKLHLYKELKESDLYHKFVHATNEEFIKIGIALAEAMGFNVVEHSLRKDGVLDLIAFNKQKKSGENYLLEIIRFESEIGELALREMNSKMQDLQVYRGICMSSSSFTPAAIEYTKNRTIELFDKDHLEKILLKIKPFLG
ncbi:MAG: tetratricopeptide repeat protein, partial [Spirochaetes bacterium]|nr:tetratricopeptide repeat protein [Spirochaetota bacterium]